MHNRVWQQVRLVYETLIKKKKQKINEKELKIKTD